MSLQLLRRSADAVQPIYSYEEACDRVTALQASERARAEDAILSQCVTQLFTHDGPTEHVFVLLHGFTNCPHQFQQLAPLLHQDGHTVLVPRLPRHGYSDRMTDALAELSASELIESVNRAVDIAHGFGRNVTVLGFSLGGVLASWLAQQRDDLYHVILVSPALGIQALPGKRRWLAARLLALLPNFFQWWDPAAKEAHNGPSHIYPRFSSRSLAVLLRLGETVLSAAQRQKPGTLRITAIDNPADPVIAHDTFATLIELWRQHGATVATHDFPGDWQLIHDLMDPLQARAQNDRVYPVLHDWIAQAVNLDTMADAPSIKTI